MEKKLANQIAHAELTKGQSRLADYILKNQKRVLEMTSEEIGKETEMSDASVIRFCRAIGYKGFADFKNQLMWCSCSIFHATTIWMKRSARSCRRRGCRIS